jgi:hypothetical protein
MFRGIELDARAQAETEAAIRTAAEDLPPPMLSVSSMARLLVVPTSIRETLWCLRRSSAPKLRPRP